MNRLADITLRLELAKGATATLDDQLEVSLDCCACRRCCRTVIFTAAASAGQCTPTGHPFPGRVLACEGRMQGNVFAASWRIAYRYESFQDAKYPGDRQPTGEPTWGRMHFTLTCPGCGASRKGGAQNNIVRPWTWRCDCGQPFYTERDEVPELSWGETCGGDLPRRLRVSPDVLSWNGGIVRRLAEEIAANRTVEHLPILADALEEAGCTESDLLTHCCGRGPHAPNCWVVNLLLGGERPAPLPYRIPPRWSAAAGQEPG